MTATYLRAAGEALYGPLWQAAIARDLGVAKRTVQRWAGGYTTPPASLPEELRELLRKRLGVIEALL